MNVWGNIINRAVLGLTLMILAFLTPLAHAADPLPRTIIAFYSKAYDKSLRESLTHQMAEMPLNHLGLNVEYHEFEKGLPNLTNRKDVRGILVWFNEDMRMADPNAYFDWVEEAVNQGISFVMMGYPGFYETPKGVQTDDRRVEQHWRVVGMQPQGGDEQVTYDTAYIHKNTDIIEFERKLPHIKKPYMKMIKTRDDMTAHLVIDKTRTPGYESHLVVTGPQGGYVAERYAVYHIRLEGKNEDEEIVNKSWYINPFKFFRTTYKTDKLPKPDTTTIAGKRIYYSHIDGDGWNNITHIEGLKKKKKLSSWVIMEKAIKPYSDLPVTVAPIAADLDKEWVGSDEAIDVAKEVLSLSQVEVGSHTYSHPFFWQFYADGNPEKEKPLLRHFRGKTWDKGSHNIFKRFIEFFKYGSKGSEYSIERLEEESGISYTTTRAFAIEKFSIEKEITGSVKKIDEYSPKDKKTRIMQWSGNTSPFEQALTLTREAGLLNINGGDSRFDHDFPSNAWVSPIGRKEGNEQQIYSSNSNENTYTNLWTGRYYGFKFLQQTLKNTEIPLRIKPINIYYHMYSGEREASLGALIENLEYARTQDIAPITTSHFSQIAGGFYTTEFIPISKSSWKVKNRGHLQTIRFDSHLFEKPDIKKSTGVIGYRTFQGSLYVYLDQDEKEPIITLTPSAIESVDQNNASYLISARWPLWSLSRNQNGMSYETQGFGKGETEWFVPKDGTFYITTEGTEIGVFESKNNRLKFSIFETIGTKLHITIERIE